MTSNSRNLTLATPLSELAGVSWRTKPKFKRLGLETVRDLLFHPPSRYDDFTKLIKIAAVKKDEAVSIQGRVIEIGVRPTRRWNFKIVEALVEDESGTLKVVWYNQPYLAETLKRGTLVSLAGKAVLRKGGLILNNPAYEMAGGAKRLIHTGRLVAIYPETEGLTSRWLRAKIEQVLPLAKGIFDPLPSWLLAGYGMPALGEALTQMNAPKSLTEAELAQRRLAFEELLYMQLKVRQARLKLGGSRALTILFNEPAVKRFVAALPFKLTQSQRRAAWEIIKDLAKTKPMNRLLEGDVGTGKTAVAAIAVFETALAGNLALIMAPTEILVWQHARTFRNFLAPHGLKVGLMTSAGCYLNETEVAKADLLQQISRSEVRVVVGTHSLLHNQRDLPPPALVIVDEQHRFGVRQRSQLLENTQASKAHLLSMTATPIPRTLALTVYGTLDISILNEFPHGVRSVITKVVLPRNRPNAYEFIKTRLKKSEQAFIICPLVGESKVLEARAAVQEYERLKAGEFRDFKIELLHGQLKPKDKEAVMARFSRGESQILIATPVVEVGVDVPNATTMIIESAQRFGLAQLHQLRGRIGRRKKAGYCFLFSEDSERTAARRLSAFAKTADGFKLAEEDLRLRGPGEFTGLRQSGLPDLAMRGLSDLNLVQAAQNAADALLEKDPTLAAWPAILRQVNQKFENIVLA